MSTYQTIESLQEIVSHLKSPDKSLIIFDVDYVLTHPKDAAYQFANFAHNMGFIRELFLSLTPLQRDIFANLMVFDQQGSHLVEETTPSLLINLKSQGYKTIALTATLTSILEKLNPKEDRIRTLQSLGIDFSSSFPQISSMTFETLLSNRETYPAFLNGILFSNGENQANQKGTVLIEFLKAIDFQPDHVVVIDDRKPNLESIKEALNQTDIKLTGLHYKGSFLFPSEIIDKKLFEEKWQLLAKKAIKLSEPSSEELFPKKH